MVNQFTVSPFSSNVFLFFYIWLRFPVSPCKCGRSRLIASSLIVNNFSRKRFSLLGMPTLCPQIGTGLSPVSSFLGSSVLGLARPGSYVPPGEKMETALPKQGSKGGGKWCPKNSTDTYQKQGKRVPGRKNIQCALQAALRSGVG